MQWTKAGVIPNVRGEMKKGKKWRKERNEEGKKWRKERNEERKEM